MLNAVFQHRRSVANVGDLACSPGLYFDFGPSVFQDFGEEAPPCHLAILGGGQVWGDVAKAVIYRTAAARHRVVWGVGISRPDVADVMFDVVSSNCALMSSRNARLNRLRHVPCASAMSPLLDDPPAPTQDVVLFAHARKSGQLARPAGIPCMTNHDVSMEAAIAFLASGRTVVTNSYHGTFWAMCLGRRVLCLPFSRKFRGFAENPAFGTREDWPEQLHLAETRPGTLEAAREANRRFYEEVMAL